MFHLTSIVTRCQEALEKDNLDKEEIISVRDFMYPENEIKYNNLEEINKLRNKNRGCLILSNHNTMLSDYVLIRSVIDAHTVAAAEVFSEYSEYVSKYHDIVSTKAKLIGYKRINSTNTESNGEEVKLKIVNNIKNGNHVIVFPEGKMTHGPSLQPFKKGIFYLAYENKIPILPIILDYKNEIYFSCHKEPQRINYHMLDDCGIDVNLLNLIYPEDFNSFDKFFNHTYKVMNGIYVECRKNNKKNSDNYNDNDNN